MMAVVLRYGWRFLTSRIGLAVVVCALLWGWRACLDANLHCQLAKTSQQK